MNIFRISLIKHSIHLLEQVCEQSTMSQQREKVCYLPELVSPDNYLFIDTDLIFSPKSQSNFY